MITVREIHAMLGKALEVDSEADFRQSIEAIYALTAPKTIKNNIRFIKQDDYACIIETNVGDKLWQKYFEQYIKRKNWGELIDWSFSKPTKRGNRMTIHALMSTARKEAENERIYDMLVNAYGLDKIQDALNNFNS